MIIPAMFLWLGGWVQWQINSFAPYDLLDATLSIAAGACAEELLFRGFVFQRLIASAGTWVAQLIISGFFLLTHVNNPGIEDSLTLLPMVNIFLASIVFGFIVIKSRTLWSAIVMHFSANWFQGTLFGFGISGQSEVSIFKPIFHSPEEWMTGGDFGLEASVPGLATLLILLSALWYFAPRLFS